MPLRALVFIALRFYAIYFFGQFISVSPLVIVFLGQLPGFPWTELTASLYWLVFAIVLWFAAKPLANRVAREFNPPLQFSLTLEDAYAFSFVFLGLYFILSSVGPTLVQVVQLVSVEGKYLPDDAMVTHALANLYQHGITVIAGTACVMGSRSWARKLGRRDAGKEG